MKLVIAIVSNDDIKNLTTELVEKHFQFTKLATTGGFLKQGNTTLICGVEENQFDTFVEVVKDNCHRRVEIVPSSLGFSAGVVSPVEVNVGGAIMFVIKAEDCIRV